MLTIPWWAFAGIGAALVSIGIWVGSVITNLKALKEAVAEIKEAVIKIRDDTNSFLHELTSKTLNPGSPLEPNELGQKVSKSIDSPSIVKGIAPSLCERANGKLPYDIQELCFDFIRDEYKPVEDIEKKIKQCAYDNGISRADVMDVLAVELRDEIIRLIDPDTVSTRIKGLPAKSKETETN